MTHIEFFDKIPADNIYSCLVSSADKVIFVGEDAALMDTCAQRYRRVLESRGYKPEFEFLQADKTDLFAMVSLLEKIVSKEKDCVFDITGGDDITLVALGIVNARQGERLKMQLFDAKSNSCYRFENGERTALEAAPQLSIRENIIINGGDITEQTNIDGVSQEELFSDTDKLWESCSINPKKWNLQINVLEAAHKVGKWNYETCELFANVAQIKSLMENENLRFVFLNGMMDKLAALGLIKYSFDEKTLYIKYKNAFVKKCLTKAGQVLEMQIYCTAKKLLSENQTPYFSDVKTGVSIDWDGVFFGANNFANGTENEIDVIMIRGAVPVFVSCKNGYVSMDELYKLSAVASRFGGKYAKKVLVMTSDTSKNDFFASFSQRATDMDIRIVDNVQDLTQQDLCDAVRSFCE